MGNSKKQIPQPLFLNCQYELVYAPDLIHMRKQNKKKPEILNNVDLTGLNLLILNLILTGLNGGYIWLIYLLDYYF